MLIYICFSLSDLLHPVWHFLGSLMSLQITQFHTILWLSDISFIVCVCHTFFIRSSTDGHAGCFYVLAVVNSAAVNIQVHMSFWIMVFLWIFCQRFLKYIYILNLKTFIWCVHCEHFLPYCGLLFGLLFHLLLIVFGRAKDLNFSVQFMKCCLMVHIFVSYKRNLCL